MTDVSLEDWGGTPLEVAWSRRSRVVGLVDFNAQLIRGRVAPWPPPAVVQKLYRAKRGDAAAFPEADRERLRAGLGHYCDLQSVHSEDVLTWNFFGPFLAESSALRAHFLSWLLDRLKVSAQPSKTCGFDLFRRVPHPDTGGMGGPENDFVLDSDEALIFGEAKWLSKEGKGQGVNADKGQLQLRCEFFEKYGTAIYGNRTFLVLGVGPLSTSFVANDTTFESGVEMRFTTWGLLADYPRHPAGDQFRAYYRWKLSNSRPRKPDLLPRVDP
jgi:hypothetical protein